MTRNKDFQNGVEMAFSRATQIIDQISHILVEARDALLEMPARTYSAGTSMRRDRLKCPWIFEEVVDAMQNAEEIGGPEGQDYLDLMNAIIEEATERIEYVRSILPDNEAAPSTSIPASVASDGKS